MDENPKFTLKPEQKKSSLTYTLRRKSPIFIVQFHEKKRTPKTRPKPCPAITNEFDNWPVARLAGLVPVQLHVGHGIRLNPLTAGCTAARLWF